MPSGTYLVQFDPQTFGAMTPADRQTVVSWVRTTNSGSTVLSPYIQEGVDYANKSGTEVIMAIDLRDVLDPRALSAKVKASEAIAKYQVDVEGATDILGSVRGVTLGITFGKKPYGKIKIDFGRDASPLAPAARALILEVLSNQGAMIDDFATWEAAVDRTQITLGGYLSAAGMRHIFSLIDAPVAEAVHSEARNQTIQTSPSDADSEAVASQKYFHAIATQLDDLRHHDSPQRIAQIGGWLDKYARKIDGLSMVNVCDEALDYGSYVSQQLRNAAAAIKGIGVRSRVRQVEGITRWEAPVTMGPTTTAGITTAGFTTTAVMVPSLVLITCRPISVSNSECARKSRCKRRRPARPLLVPS